MNYFTAKKMYSASLTEHGSQFLLIKKGSQQQNVHEFSLSVSLAILTKQGVVFSDIILIYFIYLLLLFINFT